MVLSRAAALLAFIGTVAVVALVAAVWTPALRRHRTHPAPEQRDRLHGECLRGAARGHATERQDQRSSSDIRRSTTSRSALRTGSRLAFVSSGTGNTDIWVGPVAGGAPTGG